MDLQALRSLLLEAALNIESEAEDLPPGPQSDRYYQFGDHARATARDIAVLLADMPECVLAGR